MKLQGEANFTHFYLLELETYKMSDNITANLTWDYTKNEADLDIIIYDLKTAFKAHLKIYQFTDSFDVTIYSILLSIAIILCAIFSIRELNNATENTSYAKDVIYRFYKENRFHKFHYL